MLLSLSCKSFTKKLNLKSFSIIQRFASNTLVIAEHDQTQLSAGTLSTLKAASKIGGIITVLVTGNNINNVANHASSIKNVSNVLTYETTDIMMAEDITNLITPIVSKYTHILAPSTNYGKNYLPRVAAIVDSSPVMDIMEVISEDTFKRPMYAGNAIATVKMTNAIKFLLIRPTSFEKQIVGDTTNAPISKLVLDKSVDKSTLSTFVTANNTVSERPELTSARVVISGGRGMKSAENFTLLDKLADKLNGAVGASRAAVDAGFAPNDYQVGQTGKVVAPDLYIAVGISGAIQHLSGMKDSKVIVAINKDKEAPIFQVADYGIVDDLFKVIPELTEKL